MTKSTRKKPSELRSARWFAPDDIRSFLHRSRMRQMELAPEDYIDKPIIAIINTWSETQPCHTHFRERAEVIKRGVIQAGGWPVELPAMSLSEPMVKPTTMLYRNMLSMETEELLRSQPVDAVVLMGGCDKTTPALVMGAISAGLPMIYMPGGPMLSGNYRGEKLGSGSDAFKYAAERIAGNFSDEDWAGLENGIARTAGHCMTMGTASTMTAIAESLGLTLPGASSIPAPDADHPRMAAACGRRIVDMAWEDLTSDKILTKAAFKNAGTVAMATGCSTNAVVHLIAMAKRAQVDFTMEDLDALGRTTPVIANIRPVGTKYLMEDFFYAGGLQALMNSLGDRLDRSAATVSGKTLGEEINGKVIYNDDVIRPLDNPIYHEGALAVLKGNLAPDGCVMKPSACSPKFFKCQGRAFVYDSYPELKKAVADETLDITEDDILVLRNAGPQGGPGMPEWGMLPIPTKLIKQGVRDMVRISDCRMSGTSYGACILHVSPESHVGGPLALLKTGDIVEVDVPNRSINMLVDDEELARRRAAWVQPEPYYERGYGRMFAEHVSQANEGCDFDFLGHDGVKKVPEPDIF